MKDRPRKGRVERADLTRDLPRHDQEGVAGQPRLGPFRGPLTSEDLDNALVVTVCDNADEELSPLGVAHLHWSVPDPADDGRTTAFARAFTTIASRVDQLAAAITTEETP